MNDHRIVFDGGRLFDLADSKGFPLEIAIDRLHARRAFIDWFGFVRRARKCGWWDFKTIKFIEYVFVDVMTDRAVKEYVLDMIKTFMVRVPHPALKT